MLAPVASSPLRVVLADDTSAIRSLLRRSFSVDPTVAVVGEAADGAEAVEVVCQTEADVVLLDLAMPVMDGLQAIPEIRRRSPNTRIVVLSGFDASKMAQRALDLGADAYLSKGAGPDRILALVREVGRRPATPSSHHPSAGRAGSGHPGSGHPGSGQPGSGPAGSGPPGSGQPDFGPQSSVQLGGPQLGVQLGSPQSGGPQLGGPQSGPPAPVVSIEAAYRRKHDLLPLLTHEIGNQLTVIQGFAEMLLAGGGSLPEDTTRQFTEAIVRNSLQMRRLLEAVSDLRQLDDGELAIQPTTFDLVGLVRETMDDLHGQLGSRRVTVALPDRAVVTADGVRVRQALTNLVANAAKFTPPDAHVIVELTVGDEAVELAVSDDGPGIPPEREGELFQKFSRLGSRVKGTGIGLYLSRAIALAHGGDLVLVPRAVGCRFTLRLPLGGPGGASLDGGERWEAPGRGGTDPTPTTT